MGLRLGHGTVDRTCGSHQAVSLLCWGGSWGPRHIPVRTIKAPPWRDFVSNPFLDSWIKGRRLQSLSELSSVWKVACGVLTDASEWVRMWSLSSPAPSGAHAAQGSHTCPPPGMLMAKVREWEEVPWRGMCPCGRTNHSPNQGNEGGQGRYSLYSWK